MNRIRLELLAWSMLLLLALPGSAETLLVVRKSDAAVDFIDPGSGLQLATVAVGEGPHEIAVSPDGRRAVVSNYGTRERPGASLSLLDLAQPRELRRIELPAGARPHGLAWYAPERIAVTAEGLHGLFVLDAASGEVLRRIDTRADGSHMVAVDGARNRAYVTNLGAGTTGVFDLERGTQLASLPTGTGSEGLVLVREGRELWVGARSENRVRIVDTQNLTIIGEIAVPGLPIRLMPAADVRSVLASSAVSSELQVLDVESRRVRASTKLAAPLAPRAAQRQFSGLAPGSTLPVGIAVATGNRAWYVAASMADAVLVIDPATLAVARTISVDGEPDGLGLSDTMPSAVCHACEAPGSGHE
jgi:YVTN family beta-propeller protein